MTAPEAIFDLAINRAATTLLGLGMLGPLPLSPGVAEVGSQQVEAALEQWHARTRFARRVPLADIVRCLNLRPTPGEWHWTGGPEGSWRPGRASFP